MRAGCKLWLHWIRVAMRFVDNLHEVQRLTMPLQSAYPCLSSVVLRYLWCLSFAMMSAMLVGAP
jgi:hypothetical protein